MGPISLQFLSLSLVLLHLGVLDALLVTAEYRIITSGCPASLLGFSPETAYSEPECLLRCTLDADCMLSVHLSDSAACYSLNAATQGGDCGTGMTVRQKVINTGVSHLSFAQNLLLWYDFRKGYMNLANPLSNSAAPRNVAERDSSRGVRLLGSSNSYVEVATPAFYRNFLAGKKFSFFFMGRFAIDSSDKCISSFSDCVPSSGSSYFNTRNNGGIHSKTFAVDGAISFTEVNSQNAIPIDGTIRPNAVGVSFIGSQYNSQWYFNGTMRSTEGPITNGGSPVPHNSYDCLRIGQCPLSSTASFDGWLQCWGFANELLSLAQFDLLRSLCQS